MNRPYGNAMNGGFDLAVIGSGFGGSLVAMIARRLGLSVLLLERGRHPRFAIGESSSPLANLLLEQLARRYDLPRLVPLTEYGKWQRTYPEIGCGLKRGFSFYAHAAGQPFVTRDDRANELLVAASPCDEVSDTHWLRADFDHFLVREAQHVGVEYLDQVTLEGVRWTPGGEAELFGERAGRTFAARARYVVDATGPRGFLARALRLEEAPLPSMPPTQGLFTHFTGVRCWADLHPPKGTQGPALALPPAASKRAHPPYPPDAAALHHVFEGGWIWVLRFDNGITSAGVAATDWLAAELSLAEGAPAWERLLARFPSVREQFAEAEPVRPFIFSPRLPYCCASWSGPGWMLLPSAGAFVDPLFSTGIPLTLLGIERFAGALERGWGQRAQRAPGAEFDAEVAQSAALSAREVAAVARLVGASYASFPDFPLFTALSMFYFAAASHSEMARRIGESGVQAFGRSGVQAFRRSEEVRPSGPRPEDLNTRTPERLIPLFLRIDHPTFGPAFKRLADRLTATLATDRERFTAAVGEAIEPLNVAGLCDPAKKNWYPVRLGDLVENAGKLGMSPAAMEAWIEKAGWNTLCEGSLSSEVPSATIRP